VNVAQNLGLLDVEVAQDHCFEAFGGLFNLAKHGPLDVTVTHDVHVAFITLFTVNSASFSFKARLIEVDLLRHDDGLCGEEDLQDRGEFGIPVLGGISAPRSKQTKTHLTTVVQVGVETNLAIARRHQVHLGWAVGVRILTEDIELVAAVGIGRSIRASDNRFHHIDTALVAPNEDGVSVFAG